MDPQTAVSPIGLQAVIVLVAPFLLQWLKTARWFPWLTTFSDGWLRFWSIAVAVLASVGIGITWDGPAGRLVIDGLHWDALLALVLQVAVHFTGQESLYRLIIKPRSTLALLLAVGLAAGASTGCAAIRPAPITNPALQLEGQIAVRGSQLVEAIRVAQRSLEPLVDTSVITAAEALRVAQVLGYALQQAQRLVPLLQFADQAREFAERAKALAEAGGVVKDLLRAVSLAGADVGSATGRVALDGIVGNVTDALGDLVMAGGAR